MAQEHRPGAQPPEDHLPADQRAIAALLLRPDTHAPGVDRVQRVDTHVSAVFLAGDTVWKLKRAVRLPFLDFSTLESRRHACEREVILNRRTAPGLYLGMAPVLRQEDGRLCIGPLDRLETGRGRDTGTPVPTGGPGDPVATGGPGNPVDWLVVMRRFDERTLFDTLARDRTLTREHLRPLAAAIARFHAAAEIHPEAGGADALRSYVVGNRAAMAPYVPSVFAPDRVQALTTATLAAIDRAAPRLDARRAAGRVRRCHGDLHLRNICLFDGQPTLFDCIEFTDDYALIDVFYDFAFLVMDLENRGLRREANIVFNSYLEYTGDGEALPALPAFLSLRAAIRAHVAAAMAAAQDESETAGRLRTEAVATLDLALGFLAPPPPRLVAVGGLSGSGKSRLGRELAPFLGAAPGAVVVRTDVVRKRLMGVDPYARLGPEGYTQDMGRRTYEAMLDEVAAALAAGHAVVADAVFARPDERARIEAVARAANVPFDGFWLHAPACVMAERITSRRNNVSDATPAVLDLQLGFDLGDLAWTRIDSAGPREDTLTQALSVLALEPPTGLE